MRNNQTIAGANTTFETAFTGIFDGAKHVPGMRNAITMFREVQYDIVEQYLHATQNSQGSAKLKAFEGAAALIRAVQDHACEDRAKMANRMARITMTMLDYADQPALEQIARRTAVDAVPHLIRTDRSLAEGLLVRLVPLNLPSAISKRFMAIATEGGSTAWLVTKANRRAPNGFDVEVLGNDITRQDSPQEQQKQTPSLVAPYMTLFRDVARGTIAPLQAAKEIYGRNGTKFASFDF